MAPNAPAERIALGDVTPNNIGTLQRLHSVLFPVHYGDKFYKEVLEAGEFAKLVYYNDICVGSVCCRVEIDNENTRLYMMTLGVLESYRNRGLGKNNREA
ncbi:N-alpha-acetyltransferase 50 [Apophysomyces sp. BC1034]|nr:N-alpha-acetyltransferase 50 [Apophysomyces sp. BC1021]KAG0185923.1 N-alpha-acetyltransferase 50 [Apophysomyces sp. BC1034]